MGILNNKFNIKKNKNMGNFMIFALIIYAIGICVVYQAAEKREMEVWESVVTSVISTPIGGLLYCLCFPSKLDKENNEALKLIHDKLKT